MRRQNDSSRVLNVIIETSDQDNVSPQSIKNLIIYKCIKSKLMFDEMLHVRLKFKCFDENVEFPRFNINANALIIGFYIYRLKVTRARSGH